VNTIILDQKEFASASSEESVCIVTDHSKWWKSINEFYRETCKAHWSLESEVSDLPSKIFVQQLQRCDQLTHYLNEQAGILLIGHESCIALAEDWDVNDYWVFYQHYFIRFCWMTTA